MMTMSCVADEANVNGSSALPALACTDVAFVDVDADGGADTVNLGGLTLLAFPALGETSVDVGGLRSRLGQRQRGARRRAR